MLRSSEASSTAADQVGGAGAQTVVRGELLEFTSKSEGGWKPPYKSQHANNRLAQLIHIGQRHAGDVDATRPHDVDGVVLLETLHLLLA